MKLRFLIIATALWTFLSSHAATIEADSAFDARVADITHLSLSTRPELPLLHDSLPAYTPSENERWWWNQIKQRKLNLADTTVRYPRFLGFCVKVYNWADKFFNSYDSEYVVGTGKRWKVRGGSENWMDSYWLTLLDPQRLDIGMASNLYSTIGAYLQYMAVSMGYSYDIANFFGANGDLKHKKYEFGFNCARFNIELRYHENTGGTYLRKLGDYNNGHLFRQKFSGVSLYRFGVDGFYFFNNRKYSHGAAYNFSKIQKKSAGSMIAGLTFNTRKISFDFHQLPDNLKPSLTVPPATYYFHYRSFGAIVGYGFNWAVNQKLLINITGLPAVAVTHCYEDSQEGSKVMLGGNLVGSTSITYNLGNFFFSAIGRLDCSIYHSAHYTVFSSINNFSGNIGFRF